MSSNSTIYNPEYIIKKGARGLGEDTDFGEVQEVGVEYIVTQKGILDKYKYYIPKNLVDRMLLSILVLQMKRQNNTKNTRRT
jgi:hypothetical protein